MIETRTMIVLEELTWNSTKKKEHFVQREIQSHLVTFRSVANKSIHLKSHLSSVFSIPPRAKRHNRKTSEVFTRRGRGRSPLAKTKSKTLSQPVAYFAEPRESYYTTRDVPVWIHSFEISVDTLTWTVSNGHLGQAHRFCIHEKWVNVLRRFARSGWHQCGHNIEFASTAVVSFQVNRTFVNIFKPQYQPTPSGRH